MTPYSVTYGKALRYSNERPTLAAHPEYQQLQQAIHAAPKEATTHLAAADWAAENGYPEEDDFRQKMAEWVTRSGENHYSGDGNSSFGINHFTSPSFPFPYTIHKKNLPEWAVGHILHDAHYYGGPPKDSATPVAPMGVNFSWNSYPDLEEGLRRAHQQHLANQQEQPKQSIPERK